MDLSLVNNSDLLAELTRRLSILAKADEDVLNMLETLAAEVGSGDTYNVENIPVYMLAEFLQVADLERSKDISKALEA